jgi:hypothetical protein
MNQQMRRAPKADLESVTHRADQRAVDLIAIIREIRKSGATSLWEIAHVLNARGIRGIRGGKWYATTVRKLISRCG